MNELERMAKFNKRRKKGMSRWCTLTPNAGNVEHNIDMFNKVNSPVEGPANNPVSGPFGGDVSAPASSGGVAESLQEALQTDKGYLLRNDGKLFDFAEEYHPYIAIQATRAPKSSIRLQFSRERKGWAVKWFHDHTNQSSLKQNLELLVNSLTEFVDYFAIDGTCLQSLLTEFNIPAETKKLSTPSLIEYLFSLCNQQANQEFCRVRTSNRLFPGEHSHAIYFRIGSHAFNWFPVIWQLVYDNRNWVSDVTIEGDYAASGDENKNRLIYNHNGTRVSRLPVDEFLNLSGNPVFEDYPDLQYDHASFEEGVEFSNPVRWVSDNNIFYECYLKDNFTTSKDDGMIELEYKNVPVIEYGAKRDVDDWDEIERHIDYTYEIDKNAVAECLTDIVAEQEPGLVFAMTDEQFDNWIDKHFDEYLKKYHDMVKEFYYEDAQHEAQETFDPSEHFVESVETTQGKYGHEFDSLYRLMQAQHLVHLFHQGTLLDTLLAPYFDGDLTVFETFAKAPEDVQFRVIEAMKKALHAHAKSLDDNFDMWLGNYDI